MRLRARNSAASSRTTSTVTAITDFDNVSLDWTVGYQKLDWGNPYVVFGGLRDLNPLDIPAALRPGALRDQETRIAFPAIFARVGLPEHYQHRGVLPDPFPAQRSQRMRHFFFAAGLRVRGLHCGISHPELFRRHVAGDQQLRQARRHTKPLQFGQAGIALKHIVEDWRTEFGLYAAQFHSRSAYYNAIKSLRAGVPYVPGDPDNLNPQYFTEFPEDIRMYGATFNTKFRGGAVFGELTYRPNQPLQYNSADLISGFTSLTRADAISSTG